MAGYVPRQGDFVVASFDPQSGHEQKGRRPAFVISKEPFNRATGLCMVCPVTNTDRGIPFHARVPADSSLTGVVMVDRLKSVDYRARHVKFVEAAPAELLSEVLAILEACIF